MTISISSHGKVFQLAYEVVRENVEVKSERQADNLVDKLSAKILRAIEIFLEDHKKAQS